MQKHQAPLIDLIYKNQPDLLELTRALLDAGADPNEKTEYFETPLRIAANSGRFDVIKMLFERGADPGHLNWTPLFHAIAYGTLEEVQFRLTEGDALNARDTWERTPFLLAVVSGDIAKAQALLDAGADRNATGRGCKSALEYAIRMDNSSMLRWLIALGIDPERYNEFGYTPLMQAADANATTCVKALLEAGVDIFKQDRSQFSRKTAIAHARSIEIVRLLAAAGNDLNDMPSDENLRAELLGLGGQKAYNLVKDDYLRQKHRVFGTANPEYCQRTLWYDIVRNCANAWEVRLHFNDEDNCHEGPVWSYIRFGCSLTDLGNGEFIEIAGQHEDSYDPDFCIYNEVFHHKSGGQLDIYMYPRTEFLPTDSHSATRVGNYIYIIGNLGYCEERQYGTTPVYRLNINTFQIEHVNTQGDYPGWIYHHKAIFDGQSVIRLLGGEVLSLREGKEIHQYNQHDFELCLTTFTWTRHAPISLTREPPYFPESYKRFCHSAGTQLGVESNGKWKLRKILCVHRVDIAKGQTLMIANEKIKSPVDDFLFIVLSADGDEYENFDFLNGAVRNKTCSAHFDGVARRTTEFPEQCHYMGYEEVSKEEKQSIQQWRHEFEQGNVSIL